MPQMDAGGSDRPGGQAMDWLQSAYQQHKAATDALPFPCNVQNK